MNSDTYYLLGTVAALICAGWAVFKYLGALIEKTAKANKAGVTELKETMDRQHEIRMMAHEQHKTNVDAKFEAAGRRDAELSERITLEKFNSFKELQGFVTRAELDRRMDKQDQKQDELGKKLDAVLHLLAQRGA